MAVSKKQNKENEQVITNKENESPVAKKGEAVDGKKKRLPKRKRAKAAPEPLKPQQVVEPVTEPESEDESSDDDAFVAGSRFAAFAGVKPKAAVKEEETKPEVAGHKFVKNSKRNNPTFEEDSESESAESESESAAEEEPVAKVAVMPVVEQKTKSPLADTKNKQTKQGGPRNGFAALALGDTDDSSDEESSEDESTKSNQRKEEQIPSPPTYTTDDVSDFKQQARRFKKPTGKGNQLTKV